MGIPKHPTSLPQIAAHLVYLQTLLGYEEITSVYWTLCLEVQFYLTLILLLWAAQALSARWSRFIGMFVTLLALSVAANIEWLPTPAGLMFRYWWGFALGALCYWTLTRGVPALYLAASCLLLACSSPALHGDWRLTGVATTVLLFLAWRWQRMDKWLADPVSQFFGRISYSLYLCHPLIGWSAQSLTLRYLNQWVALTVGIAASLLSSWLTYRFIERPSVTLSHRVSLDPEPLKTHARTEAVQPTADVNDRLPTIPRDPPAPS
jgi:hypothetical protein